jgi:hypothetical protein
VFERSSASESGTALVIAMLALLLVATLGIALVLAVTVETLIAGSYRDAIEGGHAADAGIERAMHELGALEDWDGVLASPDGLHASVRSSFLGASLVPVLADGREVDLALVAKAANCPHLLSAGPAACTAASMDAVTDDRPWGANNPRWRLYAHGPLDNLLPGRIRSPFYVTVWAADDPAETDDDPAVDGAPGVGVAQNPGRGVIQLRGEAFGPGGARRVVQVTVARVGSGEGEQGYTGQRGRDEQNRQGSRFGVQAAGTVLSGVAVTLEGGLAGLR